MRKGDTTVRCYICHKRVPISSAENITIRGVSHSGKCKDNPNCKRETKAEKNARMRERIAAIARASMG